MSAKPEDVKFRIIKSGQEELRGGEIDFNTLLCQLNQSAEVLEATVLFISKHGMSVERDGVTSNLLLATSKKAVSSLFSNICQLEATLGVSPDYSKLKSEFY